MYGSVNLMGRLGGILAPFMSEYCQPNYVLIFFSAVGMISVIFLRNQKYSDNIYLKELQDNNILIPTLSLRKRNDTI